jgi:hypothetical protein
MSRSANTIIRPHLRDFQNKAKYSAIAVTIYDPVYLTVVITMQKFNLYIVFLHFYSTWPDQSQEPS